MSKQKNMKDVITKNKEDAYYYLDGIIRCVERAKRLIELDAPMAVVNNESKMIQRRALSAMSCYEAHALMKFAETENEDSNP